MAKATATKRARKFEMVDGDVIKRESALAPLTISVPCKMCNKNRWTSPGQRIFSLCKDCRS